MEDKHVNLVTYDGFEDLNNFRFKDLEEYRKNKINSAQNQIWFIKKQFPNKMISMLELGSGNSRTLYAMENAGILKKGYGIELSESRHKFAELWKKEGNFKKVENFQGDVTKINFEKLLSNSYDLCFCVDVAFQFFEPINKEAPLNVLKNVYNQLNDGGKIILELSEFKNIISRCKGGKIKLWEEFSPPDPWRFSLSTFNYNKENKFLDCRNIFIKREGFGFFETSMTFRLYEPEEISAILKEIGFKKVKTFKNWENKPLDDKHLEFMVVGTK